MHKSSIAELLNLVGALFSLDPADTRMRPFLAELAKQSTAMASSNATESEAEAALIPARLGQPFDEAALHRTYMDLFVGPAPLEAPPWGSVYLDVERSLYGPSTSRLRDFLIEEGISTKAPSSGPEDHFGTLCWIGAWLVAEGRLEAFDELLGQHVLTWAPRYLQALGLAAQARVSSGEETAAFYADAAVLAEAVLRIAAEDRAIPFPMNAGAGMAMQP